MGQSEAPSLALVEWGSSYPSHSFWPWLSAGVTCVTMVLDQFVLMEPGRCTTGLLGKIAWSQNTSLLQSALVKDPQSVKMVQHQKSGLTHVLMMRRNAPKEREMDHMTSHSMPVLMVPTASVQEVARVASSATKDVEIIRSATKDVNQECHTVHGSLRTVILTMVPEYITQDLTDQETRNITGKEIILVMNQSMLDP